MPIRADDFQDNINFDDITKLYLFDKKLRQLLMDAIERIEIHVRSIIAHELGRLDPLAYQKECYINPNVMKEKKRGDNCNYSLWDEWTVVQRARVLKSKEDCIVWHKKRNRKIPFWVVIGCWDFGLMSKFLPSASSLLQFTGRFPCRSFLLWLFYYLMRLRRVNLR